MLRAFVFSAFCLLCVCAAPRLSAAAADSGKTDAGRSVPPSLRELETLRKLNTPLPTDESGMPADLRLDSMREAALSYGARGGLAWRTYAIRQELDARTAYLDKVFDFRQLLIPAPSGLLIEPPIVSESENAMIISGGGRQAAIADRVYNISRNAAIVSTARNWRNYLEREWGAVTPPPDILRPSDDKERALWVRAVNEGWEKGIAQADDIFEQDLSQLTAHYQGMVRYRMLLTQGMVSAPYALQVDRGITGGGARMRVGDRAVEITGMPELMTGAGTWQPANR